MQFGFIPTEDEMWVRIILSLGNRLVTAILERQAVSFHARSRSRVRYSH